MLTNLLLLIIGIVLIVCYVKLRNRIVENRIQQIAFHQSNQNLIKENFRQMSNKEEQLDEKLGTLEERLDTISAGVGRLQTTLNDLRVEFEEFKEDNPELEDELATTDRLLSKAEGIVNSLPATPVNDPQPDQSTQTDVPQIPGEPTPDSPEAGEQVPAEDADNPEDGDIPTGN
jgi:chromosome segregation ATPase